MCAILPPRPLEQLARLGKLQARVARIEAGGIAVAEVAEEVRFDAALRLDLRRRFVLPHRDRKELLVHLRIVEAGHGSAVQAKRARGENEIRALQAAVAEGGDLRQLGGVDEV